MVENSSNSEDIVENAMNGHEYAKLDDENSHDTKVRVSLYEETNSIINDEVEFKKHFKMSRSSFEVFVERYYEDWTTINGRAAIKLETGFLLMLWTLAHKESFKIVSARFNLAKGHAHNVFMKACRLLYDDKSYYIRWPDDKELDDIVNDFKILHGDDSFPGVIGCLGKTHIRIRGHNADDNYINYYGYKSVQVQAVCNADRSFTNVYVGWPGSALDAIVWQNNPLYSLLREKNLKKNYHLVANATFPVSTFLMTPFLNEGNLNNKEKAFNEILNSVREDIDQTILEMKSCFKRIQDLDMNKIEYAKYIIMSVFVIYNFIISREETIQFDEYANDEFLNNEDDDFCACGGDPEGVLKRDRISNGLNWH